MEMRSATVFLQLVTVILHITYIKGQVGVGEHGGMTTPTTGQDIEETLMDSLTGEGDEMPSNFILEVLQSLHMRTLNCSTNMSAVEIKHMQDVKKLMKYHHSMENVIAKPDFARFSDGDRSTVETNFHHTMKYMEKVRDQRLKKVKARCDTEQTKWLTTRFVALIHHGEELLRRGLEPYRQMMDRIRFCREKIYQHLNSCRNTNSFDLLYCYMDELHTILKWIDEFIWDMQNIALNVLGDDEDLELTGSGQAADTGDDPDTVDTTPEDDQDISIGSDTESFPDTEENDIPEVEKISETTSTNPKTPSPSPTTTIVHKVQLPPDFFGEGPVIIDPSEDTPTTTTEAMPTSKEATPTTATETTPSDPSPQDGGVDVGVGDLTTGAGHEEVTPISSHPSPSGPRGGSVTGSPARVGTEGDSSQTPRAETTSRATVPWLGKVFDEVLENRERQDDRESSSRDSGRDSGKKKGLGVDVEVEGNGNEGEVDINVDLGGPIHENLVQDPASPEADDESRSYTTYILIYFFISLAVIIVIFAVTVITMVTIWKVRSRRRATPKYMPLVSEKDMLDVMKKTGYVNPTYTFYSQS